MDDRSPGYSDAYDPRVSGRISVAALQSPSSTSYLPADLLFSLLLSKSLLALSLLFARNWVLAQGYSVWSLAALVLAGGGVGLALWEKVWDKPKGGSKRRETPASPLYPVLFALEVVLYLLALSKLSVLRHVALTSFCALWTRGLPLSFLSSAGGKKVYGTSNATFITIGMVIFSYILDSFLSARVSFLGYSYLLLHLLVCGQRVEMLSNQYGDDESRARSHAFGVMLAATLTSAFALVRWTLTAAETAEILVDTSSQFSLPLPTLNLLLAAGSVLSFTYVLVDPLLSRALLSHFPATRQISAGWPLATGSAMLIGYVGFGQGASLAELVIGGFAWTAISHLVSSDPRNAGFSSTYSSTSASASNTPLLANLASFYRTLRTTIKTILATPDSRRIYFFLCLNLAYMVIQMVYGVLTNSLGLISDSIHMFFDCLALGMGLFASVMATWEPNEKFTYGYSRVETLSGFANGLFLCLISIFIVFEAIQRLIDPPEMNTSQLLVVSSVGLAVNLVGMFATGHHHHGHSHGGHDHGHEHAPKPKAKALPSHEHNDHDHSHSHSSHNHASHDHTSHNHSGHNHSEQPHHDHSDIYSPTKSAQNHNHDHSSHDHSAHATPSRDHSSHDHSSHDHSSHNHSSHDHSSHGHNRDHDHDHDHDHDEDGDDHDHSGHSHAGHSHNMKGVFLHVMADTLGSVGVIVSTLLINRYGWTGFDPLASIFIAVLIFASVVPLVVDSGRLLVLDMGEEREAEVQKALISLNHLEGVASYSAARFWAKDPSTMIGSIKIQLAASPSSHDPTSTNILPQRYANIEKVKSRVNKALRGGIGGLAELTIQVEGTR